MLSSIARAGVIAAALVAASTSFAWAVETTATPAPAKTAAPAAAKVAQDSATAPLPTPDPFTWSGSFRSYYFTRQNASNNPGAQFNFSSPKYSTTGVNQASLNNAIDLHADYHFAGGNWFVGGSYFYAQPFTGACSVATQHAKGDPCVSQRPPNTNPDDTLPGFMMSTFPEAYLAYQDKQVYGKLGDQLFSSPWAGPYDGTRLKPAAFQGLDVSYLFNNAFTFEAADMIQFQNRTSNTFNSNTLLTSYPAGGGGLASNIYFPGGGGINTPGFLYGHVGYAPKDANYTVNGYLYGVTHLVTMYWFDGKYTWNQMSYKPFIALQGGTESNAGYSYIGKIQSSAIGAQVGATVPAGKYGGVLLAGGFDYVPWHTDTVNLPAGVTCNNSNYQIGAKGATLAYFLPLNAAQCFTNANGTTNINYGGWASPYTDNYATDPFFTTQISQGVADRRAPGTSFKFAATFTSNNKRVVFIASDAWYNYGNSLASQNTNEWNLDGSYRFSPVTKTRYKGLLLRYRYAQRSLSNTFCGAAGSSCPALAPSGTSYLGGLPLFKYNRAQLEYDF